MIWEDNFVGGEWLGKEAMEEPIDAGPKIYGVAKDKRLHNIDSRCDGGWDEPTNVKECGAGDRVVEELGEVANVGVVDGEMIMEVATRIETKGGHDFVEGLIVGKRCTNGDPGDR
jgi:hypothetical protein